MRTISVGHSPDADDIFMYYAIKFGWVSLPEVKFENTINRISGEAMPRQIERSISGSIYPLEIVYQVSVNDSDYKELLEDISTLCNGMRLLQYDYLGGHGTRGYGKIKFSGLNIKSVLGDVHDNILNECNCVFTTKGKSK